MESSRCSGKFDIENSRSNGELEFGRTTKSPNLVPKQVMYVLVMLDMILENGIFKFGRFKLLRNGTCT